MSSVIAIGIKFLAILLKYLVILLIFHFIFHNSGNLKGEDEYVLNNYEKRFFYLNQGEQKWFHFSMKPFTMRELTGSNRRPLPIVNRDALNTVKGKVLHLNNIFPGFNA